MQSKIYIDQIIRENQIIQLQTEVNILYIDSVKSFQLFQLLSFIMSTLLLFQEEKKQSDSMISGQNNDHYRKKLLYPNKEKCTPMTNKMKNQRDIIQ